LESFGNLQFWSLEFQILAELVPGGIFLKGKSIFILGKSKRVKNSPWNKRLVKSASLVPGIWKITKLVPGCFILENINFGSRNIQTWQFWSL
jgi:hypothetical protein